MGLKRHRRGFWRDVDLVTTLGGESRASSMRLGRRVDVRMCFTAESIVWGAHCVARVKLTLLRVSLLRGLLQHHHTQLVLGVLLLLVHRLLRWGLLWLVHRLLVLLLYQPQPHVAAGW